MYKLVERILTTSIIHSLTYLGTIMSLVLEKALTSVIFLSDFKWVSHC
jgi:hypothetical protein